MTVEKKSFGSAKFQLNKTDVMEVLKNALMVGLAALLTFVADNIGNIEMSESFVIVIPMVTLALNAAIRWIKDNTFGGAEEVAVVTDETE